MTDTAPPPPPPGSPYASGPPAPTPGHDPNGAPTAPTAPTGYEPTAPQPDPYAGYQQPAPSSGYAPPAYPTQPAPDPTAYGQPAAPAAAAWEHAPAPAPPSTKVAVARLAQVVALAAMLVGLSLPFDRTLWASATAWAVFAAVAAIVQLAPLVGPAMGLTVERSWTIGAVATGAILVFWLLVAAPSAASNEGFFLTLAAGCAAIGTWWSPGNRW